MGLTWIVIYNMYLYIGVGGLRALQAFNAEEQTWGSPHANVKPEPRTQRPNFKEDALILRNRLTMLSSNSY